MFGKIREAKISLKSLAIYRGLLQDPVVKGLCLIFEDLENEKSTFSQFINDYGHFCYMLAEHSPENSLKKYVAERIIFDENAFSRQSGEVHLNELNESIKKAVERDLACLHKAVLVSAKDIKKAAFERFGESAFEKDMIENLPEWEVDGNGNADAGDILLTLQSSNDWKECIKALADFHRLNGSGVFARYKGFIWERNGENGCLTGVTSPDPVRFRDLIGYEREREVVIHNTLQFLNGYPANNILLYGDRGTGKSSTVKALLNEYGHLGLRIIELPKALLVDLHSILKIIHGRQQKFIIFIDDLAFGDNEEEYTALKAVLEGSLESKPQNVVIYATSNRRHLVKERFSDRSGLASDNRDDEIRAADTMQEKLSLADRFGITVIFLSPDKKQFLDIVEGLAKNRNLDIDKETLHKEALQWEMHYNGRSPRTARQFIDWLEGQRS